MARNPATIRSYWRENKRKERSIDRELGMRFRAWEQMPGESYHDFRKRLTTKTAQSGKTYRAWEKIPNESDREFRKRLRSKRLPF